MQRNLGIVLGVVAAVVSLGWFFFLRSGPASVSSAPAEPVAPPPTVRSVPATPSAPPPSRTEVAPAEDAGPTPADVDGCGSLEAVYARLADGGLSDEDRACLDARIEADDDTENVLRLLAVEAWNRDEDEWARRAVQLSSITIDPDLHYKLALHFFDREQPAVALHHADVAMEESHAWPPAVVGTRTDRLDRMRQALCEGNPELDGCR